MSRLAHASEEHELPGIEAMLAGTFALMTGYCQAMQAALNPQHRLLMGAKIGRNLAQLADHPMLSSGFQQVLAGLQRRWTLMSACTGDAAPFGAGPGQAETSDAPCCCAAPKLLQ